MTKPKMVKLSEETHKMITSLANYGDTLDSVIQRAVKFYSESKATGGKRK